MGGGKKKGGRRGKGGRGIGEGRGKNQEEEKGEGSGEGKKKETLVFQLAPLPIIPRASSQTANV